MATPERMARIERVQTLRHGSVVVLEDVHDPHNAQAVFRSCDVFGFGEVWLIFAREPRFNPRALGKSSSASAHKWLTFRIYTSVQECYEALEAAGFISYATILDATAQSLLDTRFSPGNTALWFGNEHAGLSDEARRLVKNHVYVPQRGMVQSLNISVTAGICMYEYVRQHQQQMV